MEKTSVYKNTAQVVLDSDHSAIHDNQLLYSYLDTDSLAAAASLSFYVKTDVDYESHLRVVARSGGNTRVAINKFSVAPTDPTGAKVVYRRRYQKVATTAAKTKLYGGVTGGTSAEIFGARIPGGSGGTKIGGVSGDEPEFVLEENSWYLITLTNTTATAQFANLEVLFYDLSEVENSDGNYRNTALDAI